MPAHFGLDVSSSSIKVVEAKANKSGYELLAFGEVKTPASLQSNTPQDEALIANAIKHLVDDSGIKSKEVYICLPETQVYTRVIPLPVLSEAELKTAIQFEAEQYIPIPLEDVYLEYQVLFSPPANSTDAKMEILLVAARKRAVEKLVRITQIADITPIIIETALLSAMRTLETQLNPYSMLVDIGHSSTDIAIIQKGNLKQTSSVPVGGEAITRAIVQKLSLSEQQAKQYKHTFGLDETQLEGKIAMAIKEPIDSITTHIVKNIRFAKSLTDGRVDQIVLSGGTALLPNLTSYLVDQLNIEVILANPLQNCQNRNLPQQLVSAGPRFASVIGLAIRD